MGYFETSLDAGVKAAQDAARAADASADYAAILAAGGGGGGTTDHGLLTGLADDDHPQYAKVDHTHYQGHLGSADLDTITYPGIYVQDDGGIAATAGLHYPGGLAGHLHVMSRAVSTFVQTVQVFYDYLSDPTYHAYYRTRHNGVWYPWKQLDNLPVGTTANTVAAGDDPRILGALQPTTGQTINAQTGTSYTLVAADAGKVVTLSNTGAITLNAPGSVFTAGQRVDVVVLNTGMATVVGTSGATVNGTPSLVSRARYSAFTVLWLSGTSAVVVGDLA